MVETFPNKERACGLSNCSPSALDELFTPQPPIFSIQSGVEVCDISLVSLVNEGQRAGLQSSVQGG